MRVQRQEAHGRRQAILDAALEQFAQRGFQGTSVREIARAVGINEATLYHYFPSKAAILDAIIDDLIDERRQVLEAIGDGNASLRDALWRIALSALKRLETPREKRLLRLIMIEGPRLAVMGRYPFLRLIHDSGRRMMAVFEQLMSSGRMQRTDPRLVGLQFLAPILVYGFHQHGLGGQTMEPIDIESFARAHVDLFARAFDPRSETGAVDAEGRAGTDRRRAKRGARRCGGVRRETGECSG